MAIFEADDGASISYEVTGNGRPVIFIHGWDANRHFFDRQVAALKNRFRVVTFDLRGHGQSDRSSRTERGLTLERCARDVHGLIGHLGLKDVVLAGWSMGTSILLDYVRQWGCDNLSGLCVIDMTPKLISGPDWDLGAAPGYDHATNFWFLYSIAKDWDGVADKFVPLMFSKSHPPQPQDIAWVKEQVRDNTPHCMMNLWISMSAADYRDQLARISVPTLLAFGGDGHFYGPRHADYMRTHITGAELVMFPRCGHALHIEDAETFNRELAAFLDRTA